MMKNITKMAEINIANAEIEKTIKELEAKGKIAWTGEWRKNRNGKLGDSVVKYEQRPILSFGFYERLANEKFLLKGLLFYVLFWRSKKEINCYLVTLIFIRFIFSY